MCTPRAACQDSASLDDVPPTTPPQDEPRPPGLSGDLADREQLTLLKAYLFKILGRLVDDIASGNVEPNPYTRGSSHSACTYCPYGAICHENQVEGRRNYEAMKAERFWQEIGKEMNPNG